MLVQSAFSSQGLLVHSLTSVAWHAFCELFKWFQQFSKFYLGTEIHPHYIRTCICRWNSLWCFDNLHQGGKACSCIRLCLWRNEIYKIMGLSFKGAVKQWLRKCLDSSTTSAIAIFHDWLFTSANFSISRITGFTSTSKTSFGVGASRITVTRIILTFVDVWF